MSSYRFKSLIFAFLATLGVVSTSMAWAGNIVLALEEPTANSTYTGVANVRGWVVGSAGINRVELYLGGELITNIPVGGRRTDIGGTYPSYPDSSNSGFSMAFNYSNLAAGQHVIRVRAIDREGVSKDASAAFNVTRFDNPFISNPASVNLDATTVSHDSRSIVINNITADGKTYDLRLDWRTAIQNYAITQIIPTGANNTPSGGLWSGSIMQFFVSSDGGRITSTGSPIKTSSGDVAGLKLGPVRDSGCGYTVTYYFIGDTLATISGNQFSMSASYPSSLQITGQFSSSTSSSGSYIMSGYNSIDRCTSQGSGGWAATKSGANAASLGASSMNPTVVKKLYDAETGAYVGEVEIYK